jgi:hypothetical protein
MSQRPLNAVRLYCYGDPDGETIKIGRTTQKGLSRKEQHEKRGPEDVIMQFLFEFWGMSADESALISDLKDIAKPFRNRREWFTVTDEARDWLRYMRTQYFVATEPEETLDLDFCDKKDWLPRYTVNRKARPAAQPSLFDSEESGWDDLLTSEIMAGDFYTSALLVPAITVSLGGTVWLDPASCKEANANLKARNFYGVKEDGLRQDWNVPSVYINPPFGQWRLWIPKILKEWEQRSKLQHMIVMAPSRATTSHEFHPLLKKTKAVFWPRGRYAFKGPLAASPDEGHFLYYFGSEVERFCCAFAEFGTASPWNPYG